MTMSWNLMLDFTPPIVGCVISSRPTGECVINIPTMELAEKVVGCGNISGRQIDKFKVFGLTPAPASCVKALLIDECYANPGMQGRRYGDGSRIKPLVLEVLKAWINPALQDPRTIHHRG